MKDLKCLLIMSTNMNTGCVGSRVHCTARVSFHDHLTTQVLYMFEKDGKMFYTMDIGSSIFIEGEWRDFKKCASNLTQTKLFTTWVCEFVCVQYV